MNNYRCETDPERIKDYVQNAAVVAFDFETSPLIQYREDSRASLDAHRACVVGVSLSVAEGSAIYAPWSIWRAATPIQARYTRC